MCERSHIPGAAQCVMASGEHSSRRFGGDVYAMFTQGDIKGTLDDQLTQQPQCLYKASQYRKSSSTEYSNIRDIFETNI